MNVLLKYRLYGRSRGRGKNNKITIDYKKVKFKNINPVKYNIIDIGPGYGESTIEIARYSDNHNSIIACEKYIDGVNKITEKILTHAIKNISIFNGNALQLIDQHCPKNSISEIWLLFPDPWPKKRHFKRRIINLSFFKQVKLKLKKGAIIHIASDSKPYIAEILNSIYAAKNDFKWTNQNRDLWNYSSLSLPKTKYYKKAIKNGLNPFYIKLIKL